MELLVLFSVILSRLLASCAHIASIPTSR